MRLEASECGFEPIDWWCVNLYPFEATIAKPDVTMGKRREHDYRASVDDLQRAKNYESGHE